MEESHWNAILVTFPDNVEVYLHQIPDVYLLKIKRNGTCIDRYSETSTQRKTLSFQFPVHKVRFTNNNLIV